MYKIYYITVAVEVWDNSGKSDVEVEDEIFTEMDYSFPYMNEENDMEITDATIRDLEYRGIGRITK